MTVSFFDRQDLSNTMNGMRINSKIELDETLEELRGRDAFFFALLGDNGYTLLVGLGQAIGCVQYSRSDGDSPYLMAVAPGEQDAEEYVEFLTAHSCHETLLHAS